MHRISNSELQPHRQHLFRVGALKTLSGHFQSASQNDIDSIENGFQLPARKLAVAFSELLLIQCHNQRDIGDRIFWQPSDPRLQKYISWSSRPFEIACQRNANDCSDPTSIHRITLDDDDRASETGCRTSRLADVGPPDFALCDYHSARRSVCRAASRVKSFSAGPTSSTTLFIAAATWSSSCRATNSVRALV